MDRAVLIDDQKERGRIRGGTELKKQIWLHVGMHKTGSSSIQASFGGYSDGTVRYASFGAANHSGIMQLMFGARSEDDAKLQRKGWVGAESDKMKARALARLQSEIETPEPQLVISGEGLTRLTESEVAGMAKVLRAGAEKVTVLAYVRDPIGFMPSAFQQRVKGGAHTFQFPAANYRQRFESYLTVFGRENVAFRAFDRIGPSVVADFCEWVGIEAGKVTEQRANDSLSAAAVAVLFAANVASREQNGPKKIPVLKMQRIVAAVRDGLPVAEYGKFRFAATPARASVDVADVEWMERESGLHLMPAPTDVVDPPGAVAEVGDLLVLAQQVRPQVLQMLAALGIPANDSESTGAMVAKLFVEEAAVLPNRNAKAARPGKVAKADRATVNPRDVAARQEKRAAKAETKAPGAVRKVKVEGAKASPEDKAARLAQKEERAAKRAASGRPPKAPREKTAKRAKTTD